MKPAKCLERAVGVAALSALLLTLFFSQPAVAVETGQITGIITDESGTPIPNIKVLVYENPGSGWVPKESTITGTGGEYDFTVAAGTYRIRFGQFDPVITEFYDNVTTVADATDVVVGSGTVRSDINGRLTLVSSIVTGRVTDESGNPLPSVSVLPYREQFGYWGWFGGMAATNASGVYALELTPGIYRVGFAFLNPSDYLPQYYMNSPTVEDATNVTVGNLTIMSGISATLTKYGRVSGTVVDESGTPLPMVDVTAYRNVGGSWVTATGTWTASTGEYDINRLVPGTYRLGFRRFTGDYVPEYYDDVFTISEAADLRVTPGSTIEGLNAQLTRYGHIVGVVTDESGLPLSGVKVTAFRANNEGGWGWAGSTHTNDSGAYDSKLVPGVYHLGFSDESGNYVEEYFDNASGLDGATDLTASSATTMTGINTRMATAQIPTTLALVSQQSSFSYGASATLVATLTANGTALANCEVRVLRSTDGTHFTDDGTAAWIPSGSTYRAARVVKGRVYYRLGFGGDSSHLSSTSPSVMLVSRALLSTPSVSPSSPRLNAYFTLGGKMWPPHGGGVQINLYRQVGRKWVQYGKPLSAKIVRYATYTAYSRRYRVRFKGKWMMKAHHKDAGHLDTWSAPRIFTVR